MPIKNYTTEISAIKSIAEIQANLVVHGARAIMINFDDKQQPKSLSFVISVNNRDVPFRLPANVQAMTQVLLNQLTSSTYRQYDQRYQEQRRKKAEEQAFRTAWRIIKDWVDAQLAIIETKMVTMEEVFLPYAQLQDGQTLYQRMLERGFMLTGGKE